MSKSMKNLIFTCVFLLLLAASAFVGWSLAKSAPTVTREEAVDTDTTMLGADATITTTYIYRYCGHTHSESRDVLRTEVSMDEDEFSGEHPNFVVEHFDADGAVLVHRIDGYCPLHYILRLEGEELTLYRPEEFTGELIEQRNYDLPADLPEQEALKAGKVFSSMAEADAYVAELSPQPTIPGFGNNG